MSLKPVFAIAALACWIALAWYAIVTNNGLAIGLVTGTYLLGGMAFVIWAGRINVHFSLRSLVVAITVIALVLGIVACVSH